MGFLFLFHEIQKCKIKAKFKFSAGKDKFVTKTDLETLVILFQIKESCQGPTDLFAFGLSAKLMPKALELVFPHPILTIHFYTF
jgi:hypothetical protein